MTTEQQRYIDHGQSTRSVHIIFGRGDVKEEAKTVQRNIQ